MVNKLLVLEHIAEATDKELAEVERAVSIEYWKDRVSFTNSRGVDLFANYLRSQCIKEVKGLNQLSVKVPILKSEVIFYIDNPYASQFRRKYKEEFNFIIQ